MAVPSLSVSVWIAAAVVLTASNIKADTINQAAITDGISVQQIGLATVDASPAVRTTTRGPLPAGFAHASGAFGFIGFGVAGGFVNGEIDNSGATGVTAMVPESITIRYTNETIVTEIVLAFLFPAAVRGDAVNEKARIQINDGPIFELTATGSSTFTWTGMGVVTNISPASATGDGVWKITNPFGSTPVSNIRFLPGDDGNVTLGAAGSDFSIVSVTDQVVRRTVALPPAGFCAIDTTLRAGVTPALDATAQLMGLSIAAADLSYSSREGLIIAQAPTTGADLLLDNLQPNPQTVGLVAVERIDECVPGATPPLVDLPSGFYSMQAFVSGGSVQSQLVDQNGTKFPLPTVIAPAVKRRRPRCYVLDDPVQCAILACENGVCPIQPSDAPFGCTVCFLSPR